MCAVVGTACAQTSHHHLRFNARSPEQSQICEMEASDGGVREANCEVVSDQTLRAPGNLSVSVVEAPSDRGYRLRVEETLHGTSSADTSEVMKEFLSRLGGLASETVGGYLSGPAPAGTVEKSSSEAGTDLVRTVAQELRGTAWNVADQVVEELRPEEDRPPACTTRACPQFAQYIVSEQAAADAAGDPSYLAADHRALRFVTPDRIAVTYLGMNPTRPPPPRVIELGSDGAAYLSSQVPGLTTADYAPFVKAWCGPTSFGEVDGEPIADYVVDTDLDEAQVVAALGLDAATVLRALRGEDVQDIEGTIRERLREAQSAGARSPGAHAVQYLHVVSTLHAMLDTCAANVEFLLQGGLGEVEDATRQELATLRRDIRAFRDHTRSGAELFAAFVTPFVSEIAVQYLRGMRTESTVSFGSHSLRSGELEVAVIDVTSPEETVVVASASLTVESPSTVSLSVGPAVTVCDDCIHHVRERVVPTSSAGSDARRVISTTTDSAVLSYALMLHVSFVDLGAGSHLGALLGYPLTDPVDTELNVLAGFGYRHTIGFHAGLGVHAFMGRRMREDIGDTIDLTLAENAGVTVDAVTEDVPGIAAFIYAGLSSDVFEGL